MDLPDSDRIDELSKGQAELSVKIDELDAKIAPMVEVFREAGFLLKLIKTLVVASTAILVLWELVKNLFKK